MWYCFACDYGFCSRTLTRLCLSEVQSSKHTLHFKAQPRIPAATIVRCHGCPVGCGPRRHAAHWDRRGCVRCSFVGSGRVSVLCERGCCAPGWRLDSWPRSQHNERQGAAGHITSTAVHPPGAGVWCVCVSVTLRRSISFHTAVSGRGPCDHERCRARAAGVLSPARSTDHHGCGVAALALMGRQCLMRCVATVCFSVCSAFVSAEHEAPVLGCTPCVQWQTLHAQREEQCSAEPAR